MGDERIEEVLNWFGKFQELSQGLEELVQSSHIPTYRTTLVGRFKEHVLPILSLQKERFDGVSTSFRDKEPWLHEFVITPGTFRKSLEKIQEEPAQFSTTLTRWIEIHYSLMMFMLWHAFNQPDSSANYEDLEAQNYILAKSLRDAECQQLVQYALVKEYLPANFKWRNQASRIEEFANTIGCSTPAGSTGHSVFNFVNAIAKKCFEMNSEARQAGLQAKIDLLTNENAELERTASEWKRMQAVLTFRHVMERLPPQVAGKNESKAWAEFWKDAVDEATKPGAKNAELVQIVKDYRKITANSKGATGSSVQYDYAKVNNAGANMYGYFSEDIHNCTGYYELQRSQWHILQFKILKLLTPLAENIEDGKVQWDKERLRFITP